MEPITKYVVAGDYRQFYDYCRENDINPRDKKKRYMFPTVHNCGEYPRRNLYFMELTKNALILIKYLNT
jgi:hypothetical protein